jgi:hypothetical protein
MKEVEDKIGSQEAKMAPFYEAPRLESSSLGQANPQRILFLYFNSIQVRQAHIVSVEICFRGSPSSR